MNIMDPNSIKAFLGKSPKIGRSVFVASGAHIIGDVEIGEASSIWFNTVIRGDFHHISIGSHTNIQDNSTVHITEGSGSTRIGSYVTIGHNAVIHACTIGDRCLVGMGSIVLDGAQISENSFIAAGSLVTPGKSFPPGVMIKGSPASVARLLTPEDIEGIKQSAHNYVKYAQSWNGKQGTC